MRPLKLLANAWQPAGITCDKSADATDFPSSMPHQVLSTYHEKTPFLHPRRRRCNKLIGPPPRLGLALIAAPSMQQITAGKTRLNIAGAGQPDTDLWLYNQSCPGPMLRYRKGEMLRAEVRNNLDVATTIHWHGIRNLNEMDGVANLTQAPIEPGETFAYEFPLNDSGTYWYHAHNMGWEQVARGLYGPLIIDDDQDPEVDHDLCLMIDDWRLDNDGQIDQASLGGLHDWSHGGRLGNWLTVNGKSAPEFRVKDKARIRLRLISAANARIMTFQLTECARDFDRT